MSKGKNKLLNEWMTRLTLWQDAVPGLFSSIFQRLIFLQHFPATYQALGASGDGLHTANVSNEHCPMLLSDLSQ
jgi:hypothetical protein